MVNNRAQYTSLSIKERIATLEQAAIDAIDPEIMASKISPRSDKYKYNFSKGLQHDLSETRKAIQQVCCYTPNRRKYSDDVKMAKRTSRSSYCTFRELFQHTGGQIANLNRVLQNLRTAHEISFQSECFFVGVNDEEPIVLLDDRFFNIDVDDDGEQCAPASGRQKQYSVDSKNVYRVDSKNVYRVERKDVIIQQEDRKGRSYIQENLATKDMKFCQVCKERVLDEMERITIRCNVYHVHCLTCVVCKSKLHSKKNADYMTFDGQICCSLDCIQQYNGAHLKQERAQRNNS